jgi:hypothetical protein
VRRHVEEEGHAYPFLWDGDGNAVRSYQVPSTSVVVILDRDGTVAYTGTGGGQDLVAAVERILGKGVRQSEPVPTSPPPPPA